MTYDRRVRRRRPRHLESVRNGRNRLETPARRHGTPCRLRSHLRITRAAAPSAFFERRRWIYDEPWASLSRETPSLVHPMRIFLMHVGQPGNVDVDYTVTRRRSIQEVLQHLPSDAPERNYFQLDAELHAAFPDGTFNCWGVPQGAEPAFAKTEVGDLVLIVPGIDTDEGGIHQIAVVRAKCPVQCNEASRILWPHTPHDRPFPYLFFFNTQAGFRRWSKFLEDTGYAKNWNPRGWYRRIDSKRFAQRGGPVGYLEFLRENCGFEADRTRDSANRNGSTPQTIFPDEVRSAGLYEGAVRQVTVNAYERCPEARRRCIDHYGALCRVCGMDFRVVYGPPAAGFIHVHHLKPLSDIGELYVIDPVADLRPVCPNCHAVIHLGGAVRGIEDARSLVNPRVLSFWLWLAEQDVADREKASGSD